MSLNNTLQQASALAALDSLNCLNCNLHEDNVSAEMYIWILFVIFSSTDLIYCLKCPHNTDKSFVSPLCHCSFGYCLTKCSESLWAPHGEMIYFLSLLNQYSFTREVQSSLKRTPSCVRLTSSEGVPRVFPRSFSFILNFLKARPNNSP